MRRRIGLALNFLGGLLLGFGVLVHVYISPALIKLPLDPATAATGGGGQNTTLTVLTAQDGTYLSVDGGRLQQRHTPLTIRAKVVGDLRAPEAEPGGSVAVWRTGVTVMDGTKLIGLTVMEACLDRRTAMAVLNCSQASLQVGDQTIRPAIIEGLTGPFPFDTQKKSYPFFDPALHTAVPLHYPGTDVIDGLSVYRFVETVEPTHTQDLQVPGNLVNGDAKQVVTAGLYYDIIQTMWVEPTTGAIVESREKIRQQLHGPDGRVGTIVLAGTFTMDNDTVYRLVQTAAAARSQIQMLTGAPSVAAVILGLLLSVLGTTVILRVPLRRGSRAWCRGPAVAEPATLAYGPLDPVDDRDEAMSRHRHVPDA